MEKITLKAYAKVNLSLDVTGRRENGYHDVDMILQAIDLYDVLTFEKIPGEIGEISIHCSNRPELSCGPDNLIYKAVAALQEKCGFQGGVKITLEKNIPIAAGMAGGSTDCAATLKGVNNLYQLGLSTKELCEIGVKLGADVPYCIVGGTARAKGIGEELSPVNNRVKPRLVLVKPEAGVSTKEVYTALDKMDNIKHPEVSGMVSALEQGSLQDMVALLGNVLQPVTEKIQPVIQELCLELVKCGAEGALMSGSGPTVFGIFAGRQEAAQAAEKLRKKYPGYFVCVTEFMDNAARQECKTESI